VVSSPGGPGYRRGCGKEVCALSTLLWHLVPTGVFPALENSSVGPDTRHRMNSRARSEVLHCGAEGQLTSAGWEKVVHCLYSRHMLGVRAGGLDLALPSLQSPGDSSSL
jgi:hypothetical protein